MQTHAHNSADAHDIGHGGKFIGREAAAIRSRTKSSLMFAFIVGQDTFTRSCRTLPFQAPLLHSPLFTGHRPLLGLLSTPSFLNSDLRLRSIGFSPFLRSSSPPISPIPFQPHPPLLAAFLDAAPRQLPVPRWNVLDAAGLVVSGRWAWQPRTCLTCTRLFSKDVRQCVRGFCAETWLVIVEIVRSNL